MKTMKLYSPTDVEKVKPFMELEVIESVHEIATTPSGQLKLRTQVNYRANGERVYQETPIMAEVKDGEGKTCFLDYMALPSWSGPVCLDIQGLQIVDDTSAYGKEPKWYGGVIDGGTLRLSTPKGPVEIVTRPDDNDGVALADVGPLL